MRDRPIVPVCSMSASAFGEHDFELIGAAAGDKADHGRSRKRERNGEDRQDRRAARFHYIEAGEAALPIAPRDHFGHSTE